MKAQVRRQLTVSLENRLGRLADVTDRLSKSGVNVDALSIVDTIDQAVVRLIPSDPALARQVLERSGFHMVEADVLAVSMTDTPGAMAELSRALAQAGVNIDYAYGSSHGPGTVSLVVIRVSNIPHALNQIEALPD